MLTRELFYLFTLLRFFSRELNASVAVYTIRLVAELVLGFEDPILEAIYESLTGPWFRYKLALVCYVCEICCMICSLRLTWVDPLCRG